MTLVKINLPDEVIEAAIRLAQNRGTTVTEVVRTAISDYVFLTQKISDGNKVILERPDGKFQQVIYS